MACADPIKALGAARRKFGDVGLNCEQSSIDLGDPCVQVRNGLWMVTNLRYAQTGGDRRALALQYLHAQLLGGLVVGGADALRWAGAVGGGRASLLSEGG